MEKAEQTVAKLQQGLQSNVQTKADAEKGVIRGPQLAAVELQLRKLLLAARAPTASSAQPLEAAQAQKQNGHAPGRDTAASHDNADGHADQPVKPIEGGSSQALAEAVLAYYDQLGHMLSCASDLR